MVQDGNYWTAYNTIVNPLTVSLPAPATKGNLIVSVICVDKNGGTISPPTVGGTNPSENPSLAYNDMEIIRTASGLTSSGAMAYKIAQGGELTFTWTWTGDLLQGVAWVGEFNGTSSTDVLDQSAENTDYISEPAITNTLETGTTGKLSQDVELAIALFASDSGNAIGTVRTWSNLPFTEIWEANDRNDDAGVSGSPFLNVAY